MSFRIRGLAPSLFSHLVGLDEAELGKQGARRYSVDTMPGFPDRIGLRDLEIGETAILLNYEHQAADTPYRSRHAIFVQEGAQEAAELVDTVPEVMRRRPISLRAFDADGNMTDADLVDGTDLVPLIERFFSDADVAYLHAHYAKRGCFAARIERV